MFPIIIFCLSGPCQQVAFLTPPHGEVINATDAWSALHDPSPLQKEIQSGQDDRACSDSLTALLSTPSAWNRSQLLTQKSCTVARSETFAIGSV